MALRTARSTPRQRDELAELAEALQKAVDALPGRFWITRGQRDAYSIVLEHLTAWYRWEKEYDD